MKYILINILSETHSQNSKKQKLETRHIKTIFAKGGKKEFSTFKDVCYVERASKHILQKFPLKRNFHFLRVYGILISSRRYKVKEVPEVWVKQLYRGYNTEIYTEKHTTKSW